jgi:hypothetical protein
VLSIDPNNEAVDMAFWGKKREDAMGVEHTAAPFDEVSCEKGGRKRGREKKRREMRKKKRKRCGELSYTRCIHTVPVRMLTRLMLCSSSLPSFPVSLFPSLSLCLSVSLSPF